jgi:hypothetical protein
MLAQGQVLLAVDRFGFTANNVTYALYGDSVGYWAFFPAPPAWGIIPVWGYADVVASRCAGIAVGERLFGFLPMASHLVVTADLITPTSLFDSSAHRAALPPTYNEYRRTAADPRHSTPFETAQMVFKPLLMLSWLVADMLAEQRAFGAEQIIVTAASSRTALGLAAALKRSMPEMRVVGLTSARNTDFVRGANIYAAAFDYDSVCELPSVGTTIADIAGNHAVLRSLHDHFGAALKYSCRIGDTHQAGSPAADLAGPLPVTFFAPDHILRRRAEWGEASFHARHALVWDDLSRWMQSLIVVRKLSGTRAIAGVYADVIGGNSDPRIVHTLSF